MHHLGPKYALPEGQLATLPSVLPALGIHHSANPLSLRYLLLLLCWPSVFVVLNAIVSEEVVEGASAVTVVLRPVGVLVRGGVALVIIS